MTYDITVGVVTYRTEPSLLRECIDSVRRSAVEAGYTVEIVVVDNSETGELDSFMNVVDRWISMARNVGFAKAANQAVSEAAGTHVLLLNPDARLDGAALRAYVTASTLDEKSLYCGWLENHGQTQVDAFMVWWTSTGRILRRKRYRRQMDALKHLDQVKVEKVSGGALFGTRSQLLSFGPFDERFFLYGEDVDLSVRAKRSGVGLFALPGATVNHQAASSQVKHSFLVEAARADAAIRVNAYNLPPVLSLLARLEFVVLTTVGMIPGLGKTSGRPSVRAARYREIRRWGLKHDVACFEPKG